MSWPRVGSALLSGLLMAVAFPQWDVWPAAWLGLIPLLWALRGRSAKESFLLGWMAGTLHYAIVLYWLVDTMQSYGHLPTALAVAVMLLLILYLGGFWGLFGILSNLVGARLGIPLPWVAAPLWCALEAIRGVLFSGFPWALLGYSQWRVIPLIQVSDLTGVYGVSFLIVLVNSALEEIRGTLRRRVRVRAWSTAAAGVVAVVSVGAAVWYGNWRLPRIQAQSEAAPHLTVGIAQGNIDQSSKWNPGFQETTIGIYAELTRELVSRGGASLVVWPETAAPFFFQREDPLRARLLAVANDARVEVLFGAPAFGEKQGRRTFYNRAYLIGQGQKVRGQYDKMHLVPFGEDVPLQDLLPFVRRMVTAIGDFSPGEGPTVLASTTGASIGVTICFESLFPEISRALVRNGADLLANLTNDAWFGDTAAPPQHLSMLVFRAVETRRWIVRSANTGISAFLDPCGRIPVRTGVFQRTALVDTVARLQVHSFYTDHGDLFLLACCAWTAAMVVASMVPIMRGVRRRHALS